MLFERIATPSKDRMVSMHRSLLLVLLGLAPLRLSGQDLGGFRLTSASVGSGRSAIATGLMGDATFASADNSVYAEFFVEEEAALVVVARNLGAAANLKLGGVAGYLQDAPWAGPYLRTSLPLVRSVKLDLLYQPALFLREPEDWREDEVENPESLNFINFGVAAIGLGPLSLSYTLLNVFEEETNTLPGASYSLPLATKLSVTGSGTWNTNDEEWMFYLGATYTP